MADEDSSDAARPALVILAVIACGAVLFWLHDIFTPLALAIFLAVMIDGLARVIRKYAPKVTKGAAVTLAIAASLLLFGVTAVVIADNATSFANQLVTYTPRLNGIIADAAARLGLEAPPTVGELFRQLDPSRYIGEVAKTLQSFASDAVFVLIYLGFILASRRGFERKVVGLFPDREERQKAVAAFIRIRDGVEQYLWVQTVTGLMIAVSSWIAMAVMGLDNAVFWAFLIFIASYIPIIGGIVGVAAPPVFALVQFQSYTQAIVLLAVLQTVQFVVGNVIQPRMQGRSLNMDPVVVLLSLALWGAIWGVPGMFLSTPITVMVMVILAQFDGTRWIAVLLSADGEPEKLRHRPPTEAPDDPPAEAKRRTGDSAKQRS